MTCALIVDDSQFFRTVISGPGAGGTDVVDTADRPTWAIIDTIRGRS